MATSSLPATTVSRQGFLTFPIFILLLNIVLYAICYQMQSPVLPYLTQSLGADKTSYGYFQSLFSVFQVIGGLAAGPLMDAYGAKTALLMSFASSLLCYVITASATTMWALYLSRIPTLFQQAFSAARTIVASSADESNRATLFGYVSLAYGVGVVVGPMVGGLLSTEGNLQRGAWAASAGSLLSLILVWVFLPAATPAELAAAAAAAQKKGGLVDEGKSGSTSSGGSGGIGRLTTVVRMPFVGWLLSTKALAGLGSAIFHSAFGVVLPSRFGVDVVGTGFIMSYIGVIGVISNLFLIKFCTSRFSDLAIVRGCTVVLAAGFAGIGLLTEVLHLQVLLVPTVAAGMVLAAVNTAQLTQAVPSTEHGSIIAIDGSLGSAVRIFSPTLAMWGLENAGFFNTQLFASSLFLLSLVPTFFYQIPSKEKVS